ncbi:hypothetical protein AB5I41_13520 [Sphingomonas sp. MMS24-JH45]
MPPRGVDERLGKVRADDTEIGRAWASARAVLPIPQPMSSAIPEAGATVAIAASRAVPIDANARSVRAASVAQVCRHLPRQSAAPVISGAPNVEEVEAIVRHAAGRNDGGKQEQP